MILIVSSYGLEQVSLIRDHLTTTLEVAVINPHEMFGYDTAIAFDIDVSGIPTFYLGKKNFQLEAILWNSRPRADAVLSRECISNIATYRSRVKQFCDDLSFTFKNVPQYPGTLSEIEYGESKILLMYQAQKHGLETPSFTRNAVGADAVKMIHQKHGRVYRKVLGPPCVVMEDGSGITTTNLAVREWSKDIPGAYQPWQYQEIVPFVAQIRCFVVSNKVWSARWKHEPIGDEWDLRFHQEVLGEKVQFEEYKLPKIIEEKLCALIMSYHLTHAAPEFLESSDGFLTFIDLNPCGEWTNVFSSEIETEIAEKLCLLLENQTNSVHRVPLCKIA